MSAEFLADENVDTRIIKHLRACGIQVHSVREDYRGSSDKQVLRISRQLDCILITEDSDFGEWIFAHQEKASGVLFLRYPHDEMRQIAAAIADFIQRRGDTLRGKFATITTRKIRIREI
ncbi:MAG: toxin-antitoxin system, toxin component [Planctomycetes bacterium]|nr:toxin-antitoxin system, toxin component [Planctomycetota bacterium]